jgi:hypothetical protein
LFGAPPWSILGSDDQIAFLDEPMMKLVGGVDAVCLAEAADLLILGRAFRFGVQEHLDRAGHTLAKLAPLVFNVALKWHMVLLLLPYTKSASIVG